MNEDRQKIWNEYKGVKNGPMERMFLEYDRYFEAGAIEDALESMHVNLFRMPILDFGCGVGDYGYYFAVNHSSFIEFVDIDKDALAFANWRLAQKGLINPDEPQDPQLVIFGEVLDHLESPLALIKKYIEKGTRFIFTSSYPYRSDDPNDVHWRHDHHPSLAREQQPEIRKLLEENYNKLNFGGQRNLWTKKI